MLTPLPIKFRHRLKLYGRPHATFPFVGPVLIFAGFLLASIPAAIILLSLGVRL